MKSVPRKVKSLLKIDDNFESQQTTKADASSPRKTIRREKSDDIPKVGTIDYLKQIFESDEELTKRSD